MESTGGTFTGGWGMSKCLTSGERDSPYSFQYPSRINPAAPLKKCVKDFNPPPGADEDLRSPEAWWNCSLFPGGGGFHAIVLVFLFLTFNIFHTYFYRFYGWLWIGKCLMRAYVKHSMILYHSIGFIKQMSVQSHPLIYIVNIHGLWYVVFFVDLEHVILQWELCNIISQAN